MNCVVCLKGGNLCEKPGIHNLEKLKEYATKRAKYGESKLAPLSERISKLSTDEYMLSRYHSSCYKEIVHVQKLKRAEKRNQESLLVPAKKGRPSTSTSDMCSESAKSTRNTEHVEEKRCIFQCATPKEGELFFVSTISMGETFLFIKDQTENNNVRAALSLINEPLDCRAWDIAYHRDCLRREERICKRKIQMQDIHNRSGYLIADIDIVNIVKCSLSSGVIITMNAVNEDYNTLLSEYGIGKGTGMHKKHLKHLISMHIPEAEFVKSHRLNESEQIVSKQLLSETLTDLRETTSSEEEDIKCLAKAASILRRVISNSDKWKFSGSMTDYEPPLKLYSFVKWVITGTKYRQLTETRSSEIDRLSSVLSMQFINSYKTDRQLAYEPTSEISFQNRTETPLSVGLSLAVHKKTRSKELVNIMSQLHVGSSYADTVQLEKRIASAVSERIAQTGGYCIPSFIKEGDNVTFAIDNIDFQENTPDGQNTLHGTLLVINQDENEDKMEMNSALVIPTKPTLSNVQMLYKEVPNIYENTITFSHLTLDGDIDIIKKYKVSDLAWFFSCYSHRCDIHTGMEVTSPNTSVSVMSQAHKVTQKFVLKKDVMPTWASSNCILLQMQEKGSKIKKTNSAAVAPLMRLPPTDSNALYTVMCMAEEIATLVNGAAAKVIITMDMDLYERALKIQLSTGNKNWLLRVGELQVCFASLHALGKYIEGSGLDLICTEIGLYSPTTIRQIFSGKNYKRGIEFHMTTVLACYELLFETLTHSTEIFSLREKCNSLREKLHNGDAEATTLFEEINVAVEKVCLPHITKCSGYMGKFLLQYMNQFGALLRFIRATRQGIWELHLASLEEQIKYYFAHDLFHYARLIPVYVAQMKELKTTCPEVWNILEAGSFAVTKSNVPFNKLFADQNLEQKIKDLKNVGGVVGLTQNESALDRYFLCAPEISRIVSSFFEKYCPDGISKQPRNHYQLQTSMALRIFHNAAIIRESIRDHCEGNPFRDNTPLMNIASSMKVPESGKDDILNRDQKGKLKFEEFVSNRLDCKTAKMSVWDPMKKMKLKTFSTCHKKTTFKIGDKLVKIREDRQLLARFLIVMESRPNMSTNLKDAIGNYEFSVVPRSLFSSDGYLHIPSDKSSFIAEIEKYKCSSLPNSLEFSLNSPTEKVCIIDGMVIVQSVKKTPAMKTCEDFAYAFTETIIKMTNGYTEGRIIFDQYLENSLKEQTRKKRLGRTEPIKFTVTNSTNITLVSLKTFLSHNETKYHLTEYLGNKLLQVFAASEKRIVVVFGSKAYSNHTNVFDPDLTNHTHEEADTIIPLHVLDVVKNHDNYDIDVFSQDTDVFILLIDLVSNHTVKNKINLVTGRGSKLRKIDIKERCCAIGVSKARGLLGLHAYTGGDWGGKFVGISKQKWIRVYLSLCDNDLITAFQQLGEPNMDPLINLNLFEKFTNLVYLKDTNLLTIPELRWYLFRKCFEGEKLPPTRGALKPHILRSNLICTIGKGYKHPRPLIPSLIDNGWEINDEGVISPVKCLEIPAPKGVIELVKCGCKGVCTSGKCSCLKNYLVCTALCKCSDCKNVKDYQCQHSDISDSEDI